MLSAVGATPTATSPAIPRTEAHTSPKLVKAEWLKNNGLQVTYRVGAREVSRFEGPAGKVTVAEAAMALDTHSLRIYRLIDAAGVKADRNGNGVMMVDMAEVLRLKREWKQ